MDIEFGTNLQGAAKIADRADAGIIRKAGGRMAFIMDLCAADGVNGNDPINFDTLAAADEFNFLHDVLGIIQHLDRSTGKLTDHFSPRYSRARVSA